MAKEATKPAQEVEPSAELPERHIMPEDIAVLAYHLWQERGCPDGSAEEDWFEALEQLRRPVKSGATTAG